MNTKYLLKEIEKLKQEIKKLKTKKKYGLVWEEKEEYLKRENAIPILQEETKLSISNISKKQNPVTNIIIEGDNYHSLFTLNYTHHKKIDIIYIDPPYNTGNKDFTYNDKIVDSEDTYKHSKWLSFMSKRLQLAKNLLCETGIIFISIDDHEFAQLKLLCDEIFGESKALGPLIWQKASGGGNSKKVVKGHEYILCYSNSPVTLTQKNNKHLKKNYKNLKNYTQKDNEIYFINDDIIRKTFGKYEEGVERRCEYEDILKYKNPEKKKEIDEKIKNGEYILRSNPNNPQKHFICKLEKIEGKRMKLYSIISGILNNKGKQDLEEIGLNKGIFDYPKPKDLIKFLLDSIPSKNAIILDFFAGSGTTGQAVLELNEEDGGNRQYILCSNKENTARSPHKNICRDITYARNKKAVEKYGGEIRYYITTFVDIQESKYDLRHSFMELCDDLIKIRENTFKKYLSANKDSPDCMRFYTNFSTVSVILYDIHYFSLLQEKLKKINTPIQLYIFTLQTEIYEEEIQYLKKDIHIQSIPDELLETYFKIFND